MSDTSMPEGETETSKPEPSAETEPKAPTPKPAEPAEIPGGISGRHEGAAVRYLPVAPTSPGYSHLNVIKPTLSPVACWRLHDARFAFDSSFLSLKSKREMGALAKMAKELAKHPMVVFGHADPTGDESYNKKLSGRRARAVYAVMVRDASIWLDLHDHPHGRDRWGVHQEQEMLKALDLLDGEVDGKAGKETTAAIKAFQAKNGLGESGKVDGTTRKKLVLGYMDWLCSDATSEGAPWQAKPTDFLARGADKDLKGDVNGCGEWNPHIVVSKDEDKELAKPENKALRDGTHSPSRRVLVYFLRPGTYSSPEDWPCPKAELDAGTCKKRFSLAGETNIKPTETRRTYEKHGDTFACRFYERFSMWSPCESGVGRRYALTVQVVDDDFEALQAGVVTAKRVLGKTARPDAAFEGKGEIDSLGRVTFKDLRAGTYDLAFVAAGYMAPRGRVRVPMSDDLMFDELDAVEDDDSSELDTSGDKPEGGDRMGVLVPMPPKPKKEREDSPKPVAKPIPKMPDDKWKTKRGELVDALALIRVSKLLRCVAIVRDEMGTPLMHVEVVLSSPFVMKKTTADGRAVLIVPPERSAPVEGKAPAPLEAGAKITIQKRSLNGSGFITPEAFELSAKAIEEGKKIGRLIIPIVLTRIVNTRRDYYWQNKLLREKIYPFRDLMLRRYLVLMWQSKNEEAVFPEATATEANTWAKRLHAADGLEASLPSTLTMGKHTPKQWAITDEHQFFPLPVADPKHPKGLDKPLHLATKRWELAQAEANLAENRAKLPVLREELAVLRQCYIDKEVARLKAAELLAKTPKTPELAHSKAATALVHATSAAELALKDVDRKTAEIAKAEAKIAESEKAIPKLKEELRKIEDDATFYAKVAAGIRRAPSWQHERYRRYLVWRGMNHQRLMEELLKAFGADPAAHRLWLRYMAVHFSGLFYASAHNSFGRPARLAYWIRHDEAQVEVDAALKEPTGELLVDLAIEAYTVAVGDSASRTRGGDMEHEADTKLAREKILPKLAEELKEALTSSLLTRNLTLYPANAAERKALSTAALNYLRIYLGEDRTLDLPLARLYGAMTARFLPTEDDTIPGASKVSLQPAERQMTTNARNRVLLHTHLYADYAKSWEEASDTPAGGSDMGAAFRRWMYFGKPDIAPHTRPYRFNEGATSWRDHHAETLEPVLPRAVCDQIGDVILHCRGGIPTSGMVFAGSAPKANHLNLTKAVWPPRLDAANIAFYATWKPDTKEKQEWADLKRGLLTDYRDPDSGMVGLPMAERIEKRDSSIGADPQWDTATGSRVRTRHSEYPIDSSTTDPKTGKTIVVYKPTIEKKDQIVQWWHEAAIVEHLDLAGQMLSFETATPIGLNRRAREAGVTRWDGVIKAEYPLGDPRLENFLVDLLAKCDKDDEPYDDGRTDYGPGCVVVEGEPASPRVDESEGEHTT